VQATGKYRPIYDDKDRPVMVAKYGGLRLQGLIFW